MTKMSSEIFVGKFRNIFGEIYEIQIFQVKFSILGIPTPPEKLKCFGLVMSECKQWRS